MIKKLMCKHEYHYYHKGEYLSFFTGGISYKWHFVCKKCGKKSVIYNIDLYNIWESVKEKVNKEKVMGLNDNENNDMEFILGGYLFKGKEAYYMKQIYKNYFQKKID